MDLPEVENTFNFVDGIKQCQSTPDKKKIPLRYSCRECRVVFACKGNLNDHIARKHSNHPKQYKCDGCEQWFVVKRDMQRHRRIHRTNKPIYECGTCGKQFKCRITLDEHKLVHDKRESNFKCRKCGKRFAHKRTHNHHMKGHGAYKCVECEFIAKSKANLENHMRSKHDVESQFHCTDCSYKAPNKHLLEQHNKTKKHINKTMEKNSYNAQSSDTACSSDTAYSTISDASN